MLAVVAKGLKGLKERVVFVGGATVDLYISSGAPNTRATDDVDCVVDLGTRIDYHKFEEELRTLGFQHPMGEKAPMCRWKFMGIKVDVMPAEGMVLGFTNRWYQDGMKNAEAITLPDGQEIRAFSVPYLLASKIEAFRDRGRDDYLASPDIEDIVALFDGCPDLEEKVQLAPEDVRKFIADQAAKFLATRDFIVISLDGNLAIGPNGRERANRCLEIIRRIAGTS